jgi:tellurite resistance protein
MSQKKLRLKNFPISFYSISLGLAGFAVAWQKAEEILGINFNLSGFLFALVVLSFLIISLVYFYKFIKFSEDVKKEYHNPIKINFSPIIAKVFLLSSIFLLGWQLMPISKILWIIGAVLQLSFTLIIVSDWMHRPHFELKHISPALFIPIVGNIIVPIAGVSHFPAEISWFFFSIGFFLWFIFMTIVFYRIIFHEPLEEKLIPTFFILMAPPAIGFIAYVKLIGEVDVFARLMYYFSLFLFIALLTQFKYFSKIKFYLSSWAYSFPLDAFTIATIFVYHETQMVFFKYIAMFSLSLLSLIVAFLIYKTILAVQNKDICVEENG